MMNMLELLDDPEFFVALGFACFVGIIAYVGGFKAMIGGLDARRKMIQSELDEARRLREEAAALLASFKQKAVEAEEEAAAVVAHARAEAEALSKETAERMAEFIDRRRKQADAKIALAETQATTMVRAAAADAATQAAEIVIRNQPASDDLVAKGIQDLKSLMH